MKHVVTLILMLALSLGTAHAATFSSEAGRNGDEKVVPTEQAKVVVDGAEVTIAFTLMVPETHQRIPDNVSEYTAGEGEIIPALEDALMGMKPGENKRVELRPEEAFGPYDDQKIMEIRRDMLPPTVRTGSIYQLLDGQPITIVALADNTAVVDLNHPLAGKHLIIDVEVLGVEQLADGPETL
jgi:FKBP-type peptidyl-prolyl cis-trans isomerase SlyD